MSASDILNYLQRFNRKERFLLVGWALGNDNFRLGESFRQELGKKLELSIPEDAFVAMDYHLDWLYASLVLGTHSGEDSSHPREVEREEGPTRVVAANQEDADLITAFEFQGALQIVIIEAKGVTGWTNKQMESKAQRLKGIFGIEGNSWPDAEPHFMIVSPRHAAPRGLKTRNWPKWMLKEDGHVPFVTMPPLGQDLLRVSRWDDASNQSNKNGERWKAVPV